MNKKAILYLLVFSLILIAPLIQNHHSQIDNSTDIVAHTQVIQSILDGTPFAWIIYVGQLIVGYPLAGIVKLTGFSVRSVYIAFNYLALIGAAFSLFFVTRKLVGKTASYLSVPIVMFCSVNVLAMFTAGVIFNVINVYIILPWTLYFVVKWVTQKKWPYLVASISMLGLFFVFHPSGMYLPFAMGLFAVLVVFYRLFYGKFNGYFQITLLCVPMMIVGGILAWKYLPLLQYIDKLGMNYDAVDPWQFIRLNLGFATSGLLCLAVYGILTATNPSSLCRKVSATWRVFFCGLKPETKLFGILLLCFALPLAIGMALNISASSARMALDLASLIALLVACTLGILLEVKKGWLKDATVYITIAGVCITLFSWLRSG